MRSSRPGFCRSSVTTRPICRRARRRRQVFATSRAAVLLGALACVALSACGQPSLPGKPVDAASVEPIKGSDLKRITLAPGTADRIGIRTAPVRTAPRKLQAIPYSAVMYDPEGKAFTYESPKRLTFVRHEIAI